ncbi:MAG TPA: ECF-type sigma factor [Chthoniobacterales bacterium]
MTSPEHPEHRKESRPAEELLPDLYEELRHLATVRMASESDAYTLQATALVHEVWLRLTARGDRRAWQNRGHFYAAAAEAMRRILIENARRKSRVRRGGRQKRVEASAMDSIAEILPEQNVLLINEGLVELEKINPKRATIVVMKFFGGLKNAEVAESLGMSERSVDREWACAKAWLYRWVTQWR